MAYGIGTYAEDSLHSNGDAGQFVMGVVEINDIDITSDQGKFTSLRVNSEGRLKVASNPATPPLITGVIDQNGGTSTVVPLVSGSYLSCDVAKSSNVMIQMIGVSATLSGYNIQFEGSLNSTDGINGTWMILQTVRTNANTCSTSTGIMTNAVNVPMNYGWECSVNAFNWFRIRTIARTSGSATWAIQRGTYATEPIPGIQTTSTQAVSGTVTSANCTGSVAHSTATTGNPVFVGGTVIATTIDTSLIQNDRAQLPITTGQQVITKPFAPSETTFQYATPVETPITNTTIVALRAAGAASIRNHITNMQLINTSATPGAVSVQDGSTVIWSTWLPANMTSPVNISFDTPLRGTAATAMNFVANVAGMNIFVSAQGYQGF